MRVVKNSCVILISACVILAMVNIWKMEQQKLLDDLRGKPIELALDMQVDSPGHCVLLGAGSALDVDRNVIPTLK